MIEACMPCSFCTAIAVNRCTTAGCSIPVCAEHGRVIGVAHINTGSDSRGHYFMQIIECETCRVARERIEQSGAFKEGQSFRKWRMHNDLSLREASKSLGVSPTDLSRIERGLDVMADGVRAQVDALMGKVARQPENVCEITIRGTV